MLKYHVNPCEPHLVKSQRTSPEKKVFDQLQTKPHGSNFPAFPENGFMEAKYFADFLG